MNDTDKVPTLLPLDDPSIDWQDLSTMKELTCVNHPTAVYLTKNPWTRGLHFIRPPDEASEPGFVGNSHQGVGTIECPCPFSDMRVVINSGRYDES